MKKLFLSAVALAMTCGATLAGPAADAARDHINAIARGDLDGIVRVYHHDAELIWVGGLLDGDYDDIDDLRRLWRRFIEAQGPMQVKISHVAESATRGGATVTANAVYEGKNTIAVRHVMTFRNDRLVFETWQLDDEMISNNQY